ncbi:MAG TPA: ABC transporter permease [Gemmatimonadaceae bacterium]|nr:ABC transporter permease [Gemmatimonadaceae bacterium]
MGARAAVTALAALTRRAVGRARRDDLDAQLAEEMRLHLELLERDERARGLTTAEARDAARRRFGNVTRSREASRDVWSFAALESVLQDVRFGARALRRSPGYTAVVLLTLALGIGANTAVFSVVDAVLMRPLVYADADRLATVYMADSRGLVVGTPSYPEFHDLRAAATMTLGFARGAALTLRGAEGAERVLGAFVSDSFLATLGTKPALGRGFLPAEERAGGPAVVLLSHGLWAGRLGGDPSIVGRMLTLDDVAYTVVGVMPRGYLYPSFAQFWAPLAPRLAADPALDKRDYRADSRVIARLRPGTDSARAAAELRTLAAGLAEAYPATNRDLSATIVPVRQEVVGNIGPSLVMLWAAVGTLLLIACANVASLALVRGTARSHEVAVRAALGAGRWRVVRQFLVEHALLAVAGGALGTALAAAGVRALVAADPTRLPRLNEVTLDGRVLLFAAGVTVAATLLFGLAPALPAARRTLADVLRGGTRAGEARAARRARGALVAAEVALAVMLVAAAGLLARSFQRVLGVPLGFEPARVLTMRVEPPTARYASADAASALYRRIAERVGAIAGVERVAFTNHLPLTGFFITTPVRVDGRTPEDSQATAAIYRTATAGYFEAMGIRVVRGRGLTEADMSPGSMALVVNERFARTHWPGADPVGRRLTVFKQQIQRPDYGAAIDGEVVGVIADLRTQGPEQAAPPEVYVPFAANVWPHAFLVVRARTAPGPLTAAVRRAITDEDAAIPVGFLATGETVVNDVLASRRLDTGLLAVFAGVALALAATGIYGVLAYAVSRRRREIGVRLALGASPAGVVRLVLREAMVVVAAGLALGLLGAAWSARLLRGLLFEVEADDPAVLAGLVAILLLVAALAALVPGRRAARVDPAIALREA